MKITKYEHACVVLEEQGKRLVIDPGTYTKSLTELSDIVGIVVTHVHPDHFDPALIHKILEANPEAKVFTVSTVAQELTGRPHQTITDGDREQCGPFFLAFFGSEHATIHESYPAQQNTGVLVNNGFYYGGDSFYDPRVPVEVLALPASAPWLKISEAIEYLKTVKPKRAFPTHNAILSDIGNEIHNRVISGAAQQNDITYEILEVGQSIEVNLD